MELAPFALILPSTVIGPLTVKRSAPFRSLPRSAYEATLDLLAGRYPSDEFAELRPRITWDRRRGRISAREGAKRVAIINGGGIRTSILKGKITVKEIYAVLPFDNYLVAIKLTGNIITQRDAIHRQGNDRT